MEIMQFYTHISIAYYDLIFIKAVHDLVLVLRILVSGFGVGLVIDSTYKLKNKLKQYNYCPTKFHSKPSSLKHSYLVKVKTKIKCTKLSIK